jgi:hypothetical protein
MSSHAYAETSSATVHARFPTPPEPTLEAPYLFILNNLLQYICKYILTHMSTISKKVNLLYVAVDPSLYTHYSASKAYPQDMYPFPDNVDEVPDFAACTNVNKNAVAKIFHAILLKTHNNVINMNATLIDTLLSLIPTALKLLYKQERMMDPNAVFQQCFDWFVIKYGCTSAKDPETNWMVMAANWHLSIWFEVLTSHLFSGITFASLSGHPITDNDMVNIGVRVLNRMGLFSKEYKTWILHGNNTSKTNDFALFKSFWENAIAVGLLAPSQGYSTLEEEEACQL